MVSCGNGFDAVVLDHPQQPEDQGGDEDEEHPAIRAPGEAPGHAEAEGGLKVQDLDMFVFVEQQIGEQGAAQQAAQAIRYEKATRRNGALEIGAHRTREGQEETRKAAVRQEEFQTNAEDFQGAGNRGGA